MNFKSREREVYRIGRTVLAIVVVMVLCLNILTLIMF